jgi:hypothetical protein
MSMPSIWYGQAPLGWIRLRFRIVDDAQHLQMKVTLVFAAMQHYRITVFKVIDQSWAVISVWPVSSMLEMACLAFAMYHLLSPWLACMCRQPLALGVAAPGTPTHLPSSLAWCATIRGGLPRSRTTRLKGLDKAAQSARFSCSSFGIHRYRR